MDENTEIAAPKLHSRSGVRVFASPAETAIVIALGLVGSVLLVVALYIAFVQGKGIGGALLPVIIGGALSNAIPFVVGRNVTGRLDALYGTELNAGLMAWWSLGRAALFKSAAVVVDVLGDETPAMVARSDIGRVVLIGVYTDIEDGEPLEWVEFTHEGQTQE